MSELAKMNKHWIDIDADGFVSILSTWVMMGNWIDTIDTLGPEEYSKTWHLKLNKGFSLFLVIRFNDRRGVYYSITSRYKAVKKLIQHDTFEDIKRDDLKSISAIHKLIVKYKIKKEAPCTPTKP